MVGINSNSKVPRTLSNKRVWTPPASRDDETVKTAKRPLMAVGVDSCGEAKRLLTRGVLNNILGTAGYDLVILPVIMAWSPHTRDHGVGEFAAHLILTVGWSDEIDAA